VVLDPPGQVDLVVQAAVALVGGAGVETVAGLDGVGQVPEEL
jgi:hypothetical protein